MDVAALHPLPIGVVRWHGPEPMLTVVVKATFSLDHDGVAPLAATQEPLGVDVVDEGDVNDLVRVTDFAPRKAHVDVVLSGSAHATRPTTRIDARLVVDVLERRFVACAAESTTSIPLTPAYLRESTAPLAPAVVVGGIAPWNPARGALRGGASIGAHGAPAGPLPAGFDYAFFNAAAPEQQIDVLRTNAQLVLDGILFGAPRREIALPGDRPRVFHLGASGAGSWAPEVPLRADTLWIDTDRRLCSVTWRGTIALARVKEEPRMLVVVLEKRGATQPWARIKDQLPGALHVRAVEPAEALAAGLEDADEETGDRDTMRPTEPGPSRAPPADADDDEPRTIGRRGDPSFEDRGARRDTLGTIDVAIDDREVLPFRAGLPVPPPADRVEPRRRREGRQTLHGASAPREALPFASARRERAPVRPPDDEVTRTLDVDLQGPGLPWDGPAAIVDESTQDLGAGVAAPSEEATGLVDAARLRADPVPFRGEIAPSPPAARPRAPRVADSDEATGVVDRAAVTGRVTLPFQRAFDPAPRPAPPAPAVALGAEPTPAATASASRPPSRMSVDRYAEIKVDVWARGAASDEVLGKHGTTLVAWNLEERRWADAIAAEAAAGKSDLARTLSAALRKRRREVRSGLEEQRGSS